MTYDWLSKQYPSMTFGDRPDYNFSEKYYPDLYRYPRLNLRSIYDFRLIRFAPP